MGARLLWWGMALVAVDVRLNDFDVFPDVLGWCLMAGVLADLRALDRRFRRALVASLVAVVASALDLAVFFSERARPVSLALCWWVETTAWWLTVWWVLVALADRALSQRERLGLAGRRLAAALAAVGVVDSAAHLVGVLLAVRQGRIVGLGGLVGSAAHAVVLGAAVAAVLYVARWTSVLGRTLPVGR